MTQTIAAISPRLTARITGFLYLIVMVAGGFALITREAMIVSGDAATTSAHILASQPLYRLTFAAEIIANGCYVAVTALLYQLLKPAGRTLSLIAAFFSLAGCAIVSIAAVNLAAPLLLLGGAPYLAAFTPEQLQALAMTSLRLYPQGYSIGMAFFGVYCILLGCLILRSRFLPWIVALFLIVAGVCDLVNSFSIFISPAFARQISPWILIPGLPGEGGLTLWLLLVGVNSDRWLEQARAARAREPA